ncbi:MAG TPA: hypothetical protein VMV12_03325 [Candidatus Micrarchaeaceae archaeon]|nr:hypothetical protein [Candidatus Micrarchaeaceae archaeon]
MADEPIMPPGSPTLHQGLADLRQTWEHLAREYAPGVPELPGVIAQELAGLTFPDLNEENLIKVSESVVGRVANAGFPDEATALFRRMGRAMYELLLLLATQEEIRVMEFNAAPLTALRPIAAVIPGPPDPAPSDDATSSSPDPATPLTVPRKSPPEAARALELGESPASTLEEDAPRVPSSNGVPASDVPTPIPAASPSFGARDPVRPIPSQNGVVPPTIADAPPSSDSTRSASPAKATQAPKGPERPVDHPPPAGIPANGATPKKVVKAAAARDSGPPLPMPRSFPDPQSARPPTPELGTPPVPRAHLAQLPSESAGPTKRASLPTPPPTERVPAPSRSPLPAPAPGATAPAPKPTSGPDPIELSIDQIPVWGFDPSARGMEVAQESAQFGRQDPAPPVPAAVPAAPRPPVTDAVPDLRTGLNASSGWTVRLSPRSRSEWERKLTAREAQLPQLIEEIVAAAQTQQASLSSRGNARRALTAASAKLPVADGADLTGQIESLLESGQLEAAATLAVHVAGTVGGEEAAGMACTVGERVKQAKHFELAMLCFTTAVLCSPPCDRACWQLGTLFVERKDPLMAPLWLEFIARLLRAKGADTDAMAVYRQLLKLTPRRSDIRELLRTSSLIGALPD